MNTTLVRRMGLVSLLAVFVVALAACGGVEGTYENAQEKATIELKKGGKAVMTMNGKVEESTWEMDGKNKVVIHAAPGGMANMVLDINSDGNLSAFGGMGGVFKKK